MVVELKMMKNTSQERVCELCRKPTKRLDFVRVIVLEKGLSACKWTCGRCLDVIEKSPHMDFDEPMPEANDERLLALMRDLVNNYQSKENDE